MLQCFVIIIQLRVIYRQTYCVSRWLNIKYWWCKLIYVHQDRLMETNVWNTRPKVVLVRTVCLHFSLSMYLTIALIRLYASTGNFMLLIRIIALTKCSNLVIIFILFVKRVKSGISWVMLFELKDPLELFRLYEAHFSCCCVSGLFLWDCLRNKLMEAMFGAEVVVRTKILFPIVEDLLSTTSPIWAAWNCNVCIL